MKDALHWWALPGQAFWALGAIVGGAMLILKPDGSSMNMPLDILTGTPFPNYLIPGLVLLTLGVGAALSTVAYATRHPHQWRIGAGMAALQIGWITAEILFLQGNMHTWTPQATQFTHLLWAVMGGLGLLNLILAWWGWKTTHPARVG